MYLQKHLMALPWTYIRIWPPLTPPLPPWWCWHWSRPPQILSPWITIASKWLCFYPFYAIASLQHRSHRDGFKTFVCSPSLKTLQEFAISLGVKAKVLAVAASYVVSFPLYLPRYLPTSCSSSLHLNYIGLLAVPQTNQLVRHFGPPPPVACATHLPRSCTSFKPMFSIIYSIRLHEDPV